MRQFSRRHLLTSAAGTLGIGAFGLSGYAMAIEPGIRLGVTSYAVAPPRWPSGLSLKIGVIADIHACEPWMTAPRIRQIAELTNSLNPDLIVLLGDFNGGHRFVTGPVMPDEWGEALSILQAPLGSFAVLGNHDWWHGPLPGMQGGAEEVRRTLKAARIKVLENDAVQITKDGQDIWLIGLGDQMARRVGQHRFEGADDLSGALRKVKDRAPIVLLAHEPFIFARVPDRVSLTLCGHTHGGQVNLPLLGTPFAPRTRGHSYVYGHIIEQNRHMIISGGLGTSIAPVRFMRPPEVVEVTLGAMPTVD